MDTIKKMGRKKKQSLVITEGAERNLLGNDILPNLRKKYSQKQEPPAQLYALELTEENLCRKEAKQIKFESDTHSIPICDTPQRREFKLYITNKFTDLLPRQGRAKSLP